MFFGSVTGQNPGADTGEGTRNMATFQVELKKVIDDSYEIEIGRSLGPRLVADLDAGLLGGVRRIAVITDDTVRPLYAEPLCAALCAAGYAARIFSFPAGEEYKTRETKAQIEDAMLAANYRRDCAVLAVGGGVVTDLAGFVAGTFARGVPVIHYATTLLAAADASIGGKTAVDTPLATNLIGLFYQPKKVYIDLDTWATLPPRELASGLAETVKHAVLADADFFTWLEAHMEDILALDPTACAHIAERNCAIKYRVVMADEREESGLREVLNLGHTVGRAVETVSDYRLLHGEAVAIGLVAAARLSHRLGYLEEADEARITALLTRAGLPTTLPEDIDPEALVQKLYTDKKVRDGQLRFVLPERIGAVVCFGENTYATPVDEETARRIIAEMSS